MKSFLIFKSINQTKRNNLYKLIGVILHIGPSLNNGHYQTFQFNGDKWFNCNDSFITEVEDLKKMNEDISKQGYCFMYMNKQIFDDLNTAQEEFNSLIIAASKIESPIISNNLLSPSKMFNNLNSTLLNEQIINMNVDEFIQKINKELFNWSRSVKDQNDRINLEYHLGEILNKTKNFASFDGTCTNTCKKTSFCCSENSRSNSNSCICQIIHQQNPDFFCSEKCPCTKRLCKLGKITVRFLNILILNFLTLKNNYYFFR